MKLTTQELVTLFLATDMPRGRMEELIDQLKNDTGRECYEKGKQIGEAAVTRPVHTLEDIAKVQKIALIKLVREYGAEVYKRIHSPNLDTAGNYNGLAFAKQFIEKYFGMQ